jgi:hypothetical protein
MKGSITLHTLSYAVAVWLHLSFCFTVRQYFNGGVICRGELDCCLQTLSHKIVFLTKWVFIRRFIHNSYLNYLVDIVNTRY